MICDVLWNHLLQILRCVAMEPHVAVIGNQDLARFVLDKNVNFLNCCIDPIKLEGCAMHVNKRRKKEVSFVMGNPTVPDDSVTSSFSTVMSFIKNPCWEGAPFVLKAVKAFKEHEGEICVQFPHPQECLQARIVLVTTAPALSA